MGHNLDHKSLISKEIKNIIKIIKHLSTFLITSNKCILTVKSNLNIENETMQLIQ